MLWYILAQSWESSLITSYSCCCSVAQSCPPLCDPMDCSRLPCPSPSPRVCSNSCPLRQWCHPTISSAVALSSSCLQSFPASASFSMSQLFTSGSQSFGASASRSPVNTLILEKVCMLSRKDLTDTWREAEMWERKYLPGPDSVPSYLLSLGSHLGSPIIYNQSTLRR